MLLREAKEILKKHGYRLVEDTDELDDADLPVGMDANKYHAQKASLRGIKDRLPDKFDGDKELGPYDFTKAQRVACRTVAADVMNTIEAEFANDFDVEKYVYSDRKDELEKLAAYSLNIPGRNKPIIISFDVNPTPDKSVSDEVEVGVYDNKLPGFFSNAGAVYGNFLGDAETLKEELIKLMNLLKRKGWKGVSKQSNMY